MSDRIAAALRDEVLRGEMQPGMRVRQELLASRFGASRIPVREALKQLETEGLIVMEPNRGAWVADVNSEEFLEIYMIREAIEPLAISESVPRMSEHDIRILDQIALELEQVTAIDAYVQLDREFHLRTYARAQMPQLLSMIERFWNSTQHFRRQFVSAAYADGGLPYSDPQHLLLMDAIRARDVDAAQVLVRLHIRRTRVMIGLSDDPMSRHPIGKRITLPRRRVRLP
ncbi:MAG: GntR family transcriptional regulator [Rhodoblastus sp.]